VTAPPDLAAERIEALNRHPVRRGRFVLYWMQQSQRSQVNHALEHALEQAEALGQGVRVVFGLTPCFPEANRRHYTFMLEGLRETQANLAARGIPLAVRVGDPPAVASEAAVEASLVVCDRGYLPLQRAWRQQLAAQVRCAVVQVESDVIVPVALVSRQVEYAARTIRPKLRRQLARFLVPLAERHVATSAPPFRDPGVDLSRPERLLDLLAIEGRIGPVSRHFQGGSSQGRLRLQRFVTEGLARYGLHHNQPQTEDTSRLSPYLHFGQLSPLEVALAVGAAGSVPEEAREAYLEQLIVRRELAINLLQYHPHAASLAGLPAWARRTLVEHARDPRPHHYSAAQLEAAATHDPYWNAAMREMRLTGYMHNHMRMYWGKKIFEWSTSAAEALTTLLTLNNRWFLDGRDPNSYAGVAWILGMHDRAFPERPIYGKLRSMTAAGLERKCDIQAYVDKINALADDAGGADTVRS
jgi:deoxyribodipyrimidine photo-lyase